MTVPFTYRECYATPPSNQFIRKIWVMDNTTNPHPVFDKKVLPNSCFNLAFVTGNGLLIRNQRGASEMPQARYFCGQARFQVEVIIKPFTQVTMIQLHPWTPAHWTTNSLAQTADCILPLISVLPSVDSLFSHDDPAVISVVQFETPLLEFIQDRFSQLPGVISPAFPLRQTCLRLQQTKGCLRIDELAKEFRCSTRHLEKQFRHSIGLTPKELTRILRIRGVVDTLQALGSINSLAQVAIEYGFYDQAHFSRVFKQMIDQTPGHLQLSDYILPISGTGY